MPQHQRRLHATRYRQRMIAQHTEYVRIVETRLPLAIPARHRRTAPACGPKHLNEVRRICIKSTGRRPLPTPLDQLRVVLYADGAGHPGMLRCGHAEATVAATDVDQNVPRTRAYTTGGEQHRYQACTHALRDMFQQEHRTGQHTCRAASHEPTCKAAIMAQASSRTLKSSIY